MANASTVERQRQRANDKEVKSGKKEKEKKDSKKEGTENKGNQGVQIDALGYILFFGLLCFGLFIDGLSLVTGGTATILDWILDLSLWFSITFSLMLVTGDIMGSLVGKRQSINVAQTIVETIPVVDALPFHVLAVVIIFLDLKTGFISKTTSKITGKEK